VTATETPATPPHTDSRRCPRCGAELTPEQEWCLSCGSAVATRIAPSPGWRTPVVIVAFIAALAVAAIIAALVELSATDAPIVQGGAAAPTPAPTAAPPTQATPTPTTTPTATPTATATATPTPTPQPLAAWPEGRSAWTVVLASARSRAQAERRARALGSGGKEVGVLASSDYSGLRPGFYVVFQGQYDSREDAAAAAEDSGVARAYPRRISPS
jgi:septal ring-binding cell division protein DamX